MLMTYVFSPGREKVRSEAVTFAMHIQEADITKWGGVCDYTMSFRICITCGHRKHNWLSGPWTTNAIGGIEGNYDSD